MNKKLLVSNFNDYAELYFVYGPVLTPRQNEILESYFTYNLSIREIGENLGISGAAVFDTLKKCVSKLQDLEQALHILKTRKTIARLLKDRKNGVLDDESLHEQLEEINNGI